MKLERLWWLCLTSAVLACPPTPVAGNCANETCTEEQRCDPATLHCVPDEPPVLTVQAPTAVITQSTFVVTGKVSDDGAAANVTFRLGEGVFRPITLEADGSFTAGITTPVLDAETIVLHVSALDARSRVSVDKTLSVDVVAPTLEVTAPQENSLHTTRTVDAAVTTSAGTVEVLVTVDGQQTQMQGGPTSWTSAQLRIPERDDAVEPVRFVARDAAGNTTTIDRSIVIDNVAPQVTITSPAADSLHRLAFNISATTAMAASVTYSFDGGSGPLSGGPNVWFASVPAIQQDYGPVTLRVTAQDLAGNSGFAEVTIFADTVAPVITFAAPSADQKFKASDLAANSSVTTSWAISDADPQAATYLVNGAASTALSIGVATSATDNPRQYTTTVAAQDRAGNLANASRSYSVDRVAPSVVTWTPTSGARMLDVLNSVIAFSEPVFGATSASVALSAIGAPPASAFWDITHRVFTFPLAGYEGIAAALDVNPDLADDHGNLVSTATTRKYFHLATTIPSGTLLASNVSKFAAASDNDGELRVFYLTTAGVWRMVSDFQGLVTDGQPSLATGTAVSINAWNTFHPVSLNSTPTWGGTIYDAAAPLNARHLHLMNEGFGAAATRLPGAVVSVGPLNREGATEPYGLVVGNMYTRGNFTRTFSTYADMVTAQSADSWAVASYSGSQVRWSRYRCNRNTQVFPGPATFTCGGTEYGGALGTLAIDFLEAVMTRSGNCLLVNVSAPNGSFRAGGGWAQRLENCDGALGVSPPASCNPNTNLPQTAGGAIGQKVAPFSANGEDTILFAFPAGTGNPNEYRLEKMLPGTCGFITTQTPPISVPNVRDFQPVQIGNKAAFIYVNTSNELRLFVR